jgi:hypothetical protein
MVKATRVHSTPPKPASEFLIQVNRLQISLMIRDPFVARAFKAAEDDRLAYLAAGADRAAFSPERIALETHTAN